MNHRDASVSYQVKSGFSYLSLFFDYLFSTIKHEQAKYHVIVV